MICNYITAYLHIIIHQWEMIVNHVEFLLKILGGNFIIHATGLIRSVGVILIEFINKFRWRAVGNTDVWLMRDSGVAKLRAHAYCVGFLSDDHDFHRLDNNQQNKCFVYNQFASDAV